MIRCSYDRLSEKGAYVIGMNTFLNEDYLNQFSMISLVVFQNLAIERSNYLFREKVNQLLRTRFRVHVCMFSIVRKFLSIQ